MGIWVISAFWWLWLVLLWTFMCKDWFEHQFSVLLGPYLGVKLLGHLEMPFNFLKNYQTFPQGLHHVIVSTSNILGIHFSVSTCLPTLGIFPFFYFNSSHPSVCVCFWLVFPWWLIILNIFSCAYWAFVCLWRNVSSSPLTIFLLCLFVVVVIVLYIFWTWGPC